MGKNIVIFSDGTGSRGVSFSMSAAATYTNLSCNTLRPGFLHRRFKASRILRSRNRNDTKRY
jgi:hypothetical protein